MRLLMSALTFSLGFTLAQTGLADFVHIITSDQKEIQVTDQVASASKTIQDFLKEDVVAQKPERKEVYLSCSSCTESILSQLFGLVEETRNLDQTQIIEKIRNLPSWWHRMLELLQASNYLDIQSIFSALLDRISEKLGYEMFDMSGANDLQDLGLIQRIQKLPSDLQNSIYQKLKPSRRIEILKTFQSYLQPKSFPVKGQVKKLIMTRDHKKVIVSVMEEGIPCRNTRSSGNKIIVLDARSGEILQEQSFDLGSYHSFSFNPNGDFLFTTVDYFPEQTIRVYKLDLDSKAQVDPTPPVLLNTVPPGVHIIDGETRDFIVGATLNALGQLSWVKCPLIMTNCIAYFLDLETGKRLEPMQSYRADFDSAQLSQDGKSIWTFSDKSIHLYSIPTWSISQNREEGVKIHPRFIEEWSPARISDTRARVSPDDRYYVSRFPGYSEYYGAAQLIYLVDTKKTQKALIHDFGTHRIYSIGFSWDGENFLVSKNDGKIEIYPFAPDDWTLPQVLLMQQVIRLQSPSLIQLPGFREIWNTFKPEQKSHILKILKEFNSCLFYKI